ncbi:uncharacterized protein DUF4262 [Actinoplanes teichomyceticus]|uniref:Uncharacterized protein DUF4262 n=2 Tax=Actinoplanes teichomyceticus TaxID=1867 RepID=A0A561VQ89_ACTTI|nr:uncharacterized protein DUF4262 [Actinoplanes teichomyceticus]GIF12388.1 hypothetical protein Ate01nite_24200 [Actinoplanes teichomyceticus]
MSDFFREQTEIIQQFGWAVVHVLPSDEDPADAVPFAYTVGLTAGDRPELIIAGLPPDLGHQLLNELAGRVHEEGARFRHGRRVSDLIIDQDVVIVSGAPTADLWPGAALARYGRSRLRLQQLVWPDPGNHFPWQTAYDADDYRQPLINARSAAPAHCRAPRRLAGPHPRRTGTGRDRPTP